MYSRKYLAALIVLAAMITFHSCSSKMVTPGAVRSSYHIEEQSVMKTDSLEGFSFLPDSRIKTRSIHDADSIWLEIRTSDTLTIRSLVINGMTVFFDPEAKKNQKFGISIPAARAEMLRRHDATPAENATKSSDTIQPALMFDPSQWVEAIRLREAVVRDNKGTRFASTENVKLFMDDNNELVYLIRFAFDQMGVSGEELQRISIGIVSQLHQAQLAGQQGGGGVATRPNISDRNRQQPRQTTQQRPIRMRLIPVNTWQVLLINEQPPEEKSDATDSSDRDDVYR
ncbi:MAG: hypothetical protein EA361_03825 [Bacteroidetes bacterium]|nr:MAG: hypothetical protein EA361_03825 [Bacteroidota bacterium]